MRPRPTGMDIVKAWEDMRVFDILDRLALCQECYGEGTGGVAFGCESCLERLSREVMET